MQNFYKIDGNDNVAENESVNVENTNESLAEEAIIDGKAQDEASGGELETVGESVALESAEPLNEPQIEELSAVDEAVEDKKPSLYDTAKVFGVSEESLTSEFNAFKAAKLFKRMNLMLTDNKLNDADLKNMIKTAAETGFESVTVLPTRVKRAKLYSENKIPLRALICYPFGSEVLKVKIAAVKTAVKDGAGFIEIPFDIYDLSSKKPRAIAKEWKTLVKKAGKKAQIIMVIDVDGLTLSEINAIVKIAKDANVSKIKTSPCLNECDVAHFTSGGVNSSFDGVKYEIALKDPTAEQALLMFNSGAETFSTPKAVSIAREIKVILGC